MEIFEQVNKVLKDLEMRERRGRTERRLVEASMLTELTAQYNRYLKERQFGPAHETLQNISRLVVGMLTE